VDASFRSRNGFTLVELIAAITIVGVLAVVAAPRMVAPTVFRERGFADELAGALRQSRAIAVASGCAVRVTIAASGYRATQRAPAGTHCATSGAWNTPVQRGDGVALSGWPPAPIAPAPAQTLTFATDGSLSGAPSATITIGAQTVRVDAGGWVQRQ
jgi:prepilin-type N-terminal cleavage/methylation domain-containing protein